VTAKGEVRSRSQPGWLVLSISVGQRLTGVLECPSGVLCAFVQAKVHLEVPVSRLGGLSPPEGRLWRWVATEWECKTPDRHVMHVTR
jgi:hypothetical protein